MNGNGNLQVRWAGFVLASLMAIAGALAYMHGTFVTYREFTAVLEALSR